MARTGGNGVDGGARRTLPAPVIAVAAVVVLLAAIAGGIAFLGAPAGGDASVTVKLGQVAEEGERTRPVAVPGGPRLVDGQLVADPALLEETPEGVLPAVGADGRAPMTAYARAFDAADTRTKVAIVISGLGVGRTDTELALAQLPPAVTLAFSPFDPNLQSWIDRARSAGHEVLIQVPMEPFDYPDSDPGSHMLLAAASSEENTKRLLWALSRATGYVGVTNLQGGRVLSEAGTLEPVLAMIKRRGLLFFDDGTSPRSLAASVADRMQAPSATAGVVLDETQTAEAIDERLRDLEMRAQETGSAVAVGFAYPVTFARINEWAASLAARGFVLTPLSAVTLLPKPAAPVPPPAHR